MVVVVESELRKQIFSGWIQTDGLFVQKLLMSGYVDDKEGGKSNLQSLYRSER